MSPSSSPLGADEVTGYLAAVGLEGRTRSREPLDDLALLDELVRAHVATFAFASAGVRLGDGLPLSTAAVYERLVVARRGGYCFEQNLLMHDVLVALGYDVTMYLARVLLSGDPHPPLTHRVTVVDLDGVRYLVDVGFGPQGPTAAVPFDGPPVGPAWRRFGLVQTGARQWTTLGGGDDLAPMYRFELAQYGTADCELGHFYSHRHPDAHFVRTLVASVLLDDQTRSLRDRDYWVIGPAGRVEHRIVDAEDLRAVLVGELGLAVTIDECRRLLDRDRAGPR